MENPQPENIPKSPIEKHFQKMTKYNYYIFTLIFASKIPLTWHLMTIIFLSPTMEFTCSDSDDPEEINNKCPCEKPIWNKTVFTQTFQTKFDVYCERGWLTSFSESIFFCGLLIGSFVFGLLSDKYGRLSILSASIATTGVSGCIVIIMPSAASFIFLRLIEGIGVGGVIVTSYVLCIEFCSAHNRETITAVFHFSINIGYISLAGISYFLRDCDQLMLTISLVMLLFVLVKWLAIESPKWLMDNGKLEEAAAVMERICHLDRTTCNILQEITEYHENHLKAPTDSKDKVTFSQLFHHKQLAINFGCMSLLYFVCGFGFYGVAQFIGKMHGNIHLNIALSGFITLPGTISSIFLLKALSRRMFLMAVNFLAGIFMIIVVCIPLHLNIVRVICAAFCDTFYFMAFIIVFLYGVELFPTRIRNTVLGVLSVLSRVGQIASPPINSLSQVWAGGVFGVMAILGAFVCIFLPETKNLELPSTLKDLKKTTQKVFHRKFNDTATGSKPNKT